ncbi:NADH:flavin oxidoreductase/NADH oxidase [Noviherbaspirillum denitrificans]|uniref:Oxidoreductase n=1 Tax=Noviherbaspirillum denitrificans TaxID=1968433 RepID=A0A254TLM0_9BURK|nr:NADH:flavin oxidoreductase/NADH oxidase [Noviherbaspirillum denitrificans]OWW20608.1 oxidoreductase [Noviherbaspirillum denitrificans]
MNSNLFSPLQLRGLTQSNRIVIGPMSQYSAVNGSATDWHMQHIGHLSLSGAGLFMIEATSVAPEGRVSHGCLGLYSNENEAALKRVVEFCRGFSSMPFGIQLAHSGRKGSGHAPWEGRGTLQADESPWQVVGPSQIPLTKDWAVPVELDREGMERIKRTFVDAALRSDRIGIELVELHAAHGYLLHQFLSPLSNVRTDGYGGSLERRMRFPLEVVEAVRAAWPADKPLGVRISATDWVDGGFSPEEAVVFSAELKQIGCDYICVSTGGLDPMARIPVEPGYQLSFASQIKREVDIPTRAAGLVISAAQAEEIVASGTSDAVVLARAFLDNPRWVWHAAEALGVTLAYPKQYERAHTSKWPGARLIRGN